MLFRKKKKMNKINVRQYVDKVDNANLLSFLLFGFTVINYFKYESNY